jgi:hypothetical protein
MLRVCHMVEIDGNALWYTHYSTVVGKSQALRSKFCDKALVGTGEPAVRARQGALHCEPDGFSVGS